MSKTNHKWIVMDNTRLFQNLSPLDHRYYLSNKDLFDRLALYLSEEASTFRQ